MNRISFIKTCFSSNTFFHKAVVMAIALTSGWKQQLKKLFSVFACSFILLFKTMAQPTANSLVPKVDKRVELLSIVFRLATPKNSPDTVNPAYTKAIDNHFSKYAEHDLIKYVSILIDNFQKDSIDIGSWEIPSLAVHLSQPPKLDPLVSFADTALADMWDNRTLLTPKFVALLKQFYKDANCETFFKSQESYYQLVNSHYLKQGIKLNTGWIKQFFSLPTTENYFGVLNLQGYGDGDYIRVNFQKNYRNTYTIFGCSAFDKKGLPGNFTHQMFPRSNLHEYIHAFTNQLIDKNAAELRTPAETILANPKVWERVKETFYNNWQFLLYESLVRTCSIQYIMANTEITSTADKEISTQEKAGFFWMRGLVNKLTQYKDNRKRYKNLKAFMPELIDYFKKVVEEMKTKN